MSNQTIIPEWVKAVTRHFTSILIIVGGFWWLATPRAEEFIRKTVNDRITKVEHKVENGNVKIEDINKHVTRIESKLNDVLRRLERIEKNQDDG